MPMALDTISGELLDGTWRLLLLQLSKLRMNVTS